MKSNARYPDWKGQRATVRDPAKLLHEFNEVADALCMDKYEYWTMLGVRYVPGERFQPPPRNWKKNRDKLDRMALFIRIYDLAGELLPIEDGAGYWLRRRVAGEGFGGYSPLELLVNNGRFQGLFNFIEYLEARLEI